MPVQTSNGQMKESKPKAKPKKKEDSLFDVKQAISFLLTEFETIKEDLKKVKSRMGL
jgi:hypothetical protein